MLPKFGNSIFMQILNDKCDSLPVPASARHDVLVDRGETGGPSSSSRGDCRARASGAEEHERVTAGDSERLTGDLVHTSVFSDDSNDVESYQHKRE